MSAGCASLPTDPSAGAGALPASPALVAMVTPSRLVPEVDRDNAEAWYEEEGRAHYLLAGMRIVVHDDGRVERAQERFPAGDVEALELPERLGSGYLFYQSQATGTRLWRARRWIGKLRPLAHLGPSTSEVMAGFDRLYLRSSNNRLVALDADNGKVLPLGPLPAATSYGSMAFADGWRGVIDTDVRGLLASFDAGTSWWPLRLPPGGYTVNAEPGGDFVVQMQEGYYRLDDRGHLQLVRSDAEDEVEASIDGELEDEEEAPPPAEQPLGKRPLRVAVERGFPDTTKTAVVAYGGALLRVDLDAGAIKAMQPRALDSADVDCQGARVAGGFGFVCGAPRGDTVIYRFEAPLGLREVARFSGPRFVSASGNGALVVRGACRAEGTLPKDMRAYCVVGRDEKLREIAVRGELGVERVVALADGRTAVLVPPRPGARGRLTIIDGASMQGVDLELPSGKARAVAERGLWLEGFVERAGGGIAGWVEAGGPVVGVRVALDGKVTLGRLRDEGGEALMAGRFALYLTQERGFESVDGGFTWHAFDLPSMPDALSDSKSRGCSPVGCSLRGWLRVGWGTPKGGGEVVKATMPESPASRSSPTSPLAVRCELAATTTAAPAAGNHERDVTPFSSWSSFLGTAPPALEKGQVGVDKGSQIYATVPVHVYVWGPKGADWTRGGSWTVRFDDRFDPLGHARSSGVTRALWSDEVSAAEAIGARHHHGYWRWEAELDPGGRAALVSVCTGTQCLPYAVAEGRPVMPLRALGSNVTFRRPLHQGLAVVGDTWYFLHEEGGGDPPALWRASQGIMRRILRIHRLESRRYLYGPPPLLVRRALGAELGLLLSVPPDLATGERASQWMVLPVDGERGELGEPVALGPTDLGGKLPPRCQPSHDGWLVDTALSPRPNVTLSGASSGIEDLELRLRLDPDNSCVDGMAAKVSSGFEPRAARGKKKPDAGGVSMVVRERYGTGRWTFACWEVASD
jgi:hypothetical protein